jgi:hypothetical protein
MTIYNFNEVQGGGTPIEVEVNQLKIGDIIITNTDNVASYNLEGVDLLKLTEYNQIVNAADYPNLATLEGYQYNAEIVSTTFDSDQAINSYSGYHHFIRDEENSFYLFPTTDTTFYKLNSDNIYANLGTSPLELGQNLSLFVNFDNFTKILCIYKKNTSSNFIRVSIYNKLTNTFSATSDILTGLNTSTSRPIAARLMPDGLIYIVCQTTGSAAISVLRTSDGIVYETWHTDSLTHLSANATNNSYFDERGTLNIDDNYNFYYTNNNTLTLRSLNKINLLTKTKTINIVTYPITSGNTLRMAVNLKNNQIILFGELLGSDLDFYIYEINEDNLLSYSITLNNTNLVDHLFLVDYNNLFISKNSGLELVYTNDFINFTQYNYPVLSSYITDTKNIDFRYNNIRLIYKVTSGTGTLKRNISTVKVAETLLIPKQVYSGFQANSYLVTDINEV